MFKKNILTVIITSALTITLAGCSSTHTADYQEVKDTHEELSKDKFERMRASEFDRKRMPIGQVIEDKNYVDVSKMYVEKEERVALPMSFENEISFVTKDSMTSQDFTAYLFKETGIVVEFVGSATSSGGMSGSSGGNQGGVAADSSGTFNLLGGAGPRPSQGSDDSSSSIRIKPVEFDGKFTNFLDYVGVLHDYKWKFDEESGKVFFFDTSIQTFYVFERNMDVSTTNSITTSASGSSDSGTSGNNQSISQTSSESPWDDIENTIENLLSDDGKVTFNRRQGKIIVEDNDYVLSKIDDYIKSVNKSATRQVAGRVDVINVKLNDSNNLGVNLNYLNEGLSNNIFGDFTADLGLGGSLDGGGFGGNSLSIDSENNFSGLVGFLKTLGSVSISASAEFNTLNNNVTSFQVTSNEEYVKSYQTESNDLGTSDRFTVETGVIKDGITMTVKPKIVGEQVMVDFSLALSTNDGFNPESPVPQIQLPRTSNKNFNQTIISDNGESRVLMAYTKENSDTNTTGPGTTNLWFMGGTEEFSKQKEVILITSTVYFDVQ